MSSFRVHAGRPSTAITRALASSAARIARWAVWRREPTVPTGMPSTSAMSVSSRPSKWRSTSRARCSGVEATEAPVELIPVVDVEKVVAGHREVERQDVEVRDPAAFALCLGEAGANDQPMQPGVEAVRIAESGQVTPGDHQRFLNGILGPVDVAEDPVGEREEAIATDADQVGIRRHVSLPCSLDEVSIHRLRSLGAPVGGADQSLWDQVAEGHSFLAEWSSRPTGRTHPTPRSAACRATCRSCAGQAPKRPRCSSGISGVSPRTFSSCTAHELPSGSLKPKNVPPSRSSKTMISLQATPRSSSSCSRRARRPRRRAAGPSASRAPSGSATACRR